MTNRYIVVIRKQTENQKTECANETPPVLGVSLITSIQVSDSTAIKAVPCYRVSC